MSDWVITVSQLNEYVRKKLAGDALLQSISVKGEISDLKAHYASGHLYFTLKDERARISCIMYRSNATLLKFVPQDGMKVVVFGQAGIYPVNGQYQLYAESMKREGIGNIYERFEQLKQKLQAEGLFDEDRKRPLPASVRTIGVATSASGAAIRDIIRVSRSRNPHVNIIIAPCQVQGSGAEKEIAAAIKVLDASGKCDVILAGRGGGSMEDLWPFNEEIVVRAISACRTPVVSCVGHETDFTLSDFAADIRAATPSNAAELAVNDTDSQKKQLDHLASRLDTSIKTAQVHRRLRLDLLMSSPCFKNARDILISKRREKAELLLERLTNGEKRRIERLSAELDGKLRLLETLNPESIKKRGYACVRKSTKIISGINELNVNDNVILEMADGTATAVIGSIERH